MAFQRASERLQAGIAAYAYQKAMTTKGTANVEVLFNVHQATGLKIDMKSPSESAAAASREPKIDKTVTTRISAVPRRSSDKS